VTCLVARVDPLTLNLDIHRSSDKMRRVDRPIGNQSGSISRLSTIGNSNRLDVADSRDGSRLWRTKETKVVDRVQGEKSRVAGLIHEISNIRQEWR
jgi:hypothetical protein